MPVLGQAVGTEKASSQSIQRQPAKASHGKAGFPVPTLFGNPLRISRLPTASIVTVICLKTSKGRRRPAMRARVNLCGAWTRLAMVLPETMALTSDLSGWLSGCPVQGRARRERDG